MMNLKELLLQFAGESAAAIKIDELLSDNVAGIEIEVDIANGVKILVEDPDKLDEVKKDIARVLDEAGYEEYSIYPQSQGPIRHLVVEVK